MRRVLVFTVTALWLGLACSREPDTERVAELEQQLEAANQQVENLAGQVAKMQREVSGPPTDEDSAPPNGCPHELKTWVYASQGNSCETYEANVRGWSMKCVVDCDEAARLAEAVSSATATCKAFCADRQCPNSRYVPPSRCAAVDCYPSAGCPAACPQSNNCFLEQSAVQWNCFCDVVTE